MSELRIVGKMVTLMTVDNVGIGSEDGKDAIAVSYDDGSPEGQCLLFQPNDALELCRKLLCTLYHQKHPIAIKIAKKVLDI